MSFYLCRESSHISSPSPHRMCFSNHLKGQMKAASPHPNQTPRCCLWPTVHFRPVTSHCCKRKKRKIIKNVEWGHNVCASASVFKPKQIKTEKTKINSVGASLTYFDKLSQLWIYYLNLPYVYWRNLLRFGGFITLFVDKRAIFLCQDWTQMF